MARKESIILNAALVCYLVGVIACLSIPVGFGTLTFATDAKEYFSARNEFFDLSATGASNIRPFLYPLFLKIIYGVAGVKGVWIAQLVLWMVAANFLYGAVKRITPIRLLAVLAVVFFATNFTLIALTYHALTEIITVFLLSWLVYLLTDTNRNARWMLKIVALAVALVLVKPLFLYPSYAAIALAVFVYRKQLFTSLRTICMLSLILLPLLVQYSVMKHKYGKWELSQISGITIRNYLVAQGYERIEGLDRETAVKTAQNLSADELKARLKQHFTEYKSLFFENVKFNVKGQPYYLDLKPEWSNKKLYFFQYSMNSKYRSWIDVIFIASVLIAAHQLRRRRFLKEWLLHVPFLLLLYIVYTSGISFYQGDRLTIAALPVGVFSLMSCAAYIAGALKRRMKKAAEAGK